MSAQPLVSVRGLTKTFGEGEGAATVLHGIDLDLEAGRLYALLGPSGSGKSTLLTILGTLMRQSGGAHHMLGTDLGTASDRERTRFRSTHIGFVFQFHHLLPDLSALENVMMPAAAAAGHEGAAMSRRAAELLDAVGLADRRTYRPAALSGGQRQRVAVARALMNAPALVLADEPTGNLDRESASQVMALIDQVNRDTGTCFLISTHDEHIAARCRERICLVDGRLADEGTAGEPESAPDAVK
jgi:lipoprotein-releasing system ATP-binding protein